MRRGDVNIIAALALVVVVVVVLLFIFTDAKKSFVRSFSCNQDTVQTHFCKLKEGSNPCGRGQRVYSAVWGCADNEVCCFVPAEITGNLTPITGPGSQSSGGSSQNMDLIPPAIFTALSSDTHRPYADGGTALIYGGTDQTFLLDIKLGACKDCLYRYEGFHTTKSGATINQTYPVDIHPYSTSTPVSKDAMLNALKTIHLISDPQYIGQTITYTLLITPVTKDAKGNEILGKVQRFSFRYKVGSPVTVTPLSMDWARSKQMTASCDPSIGCRAIFYQIQSNESTCAAPENAKAVENAPMIPVTYCLIQGGRIANCGFKTLDSCAKSADTADDEFNAAIQTVRTKAQERMLAEAQMMQLLAQERRVGSYTCQVDLSKELSGSYVNKPLKTIMNVERQSAQISLDRTFMANQYVCVFGQDRNNPDRFYAAGKPQAIKIDTIPPTATVEFRPFSKKLIFTCDDSAGGEGQSGCKEAFWIQYISDVTKFFPALFGGTGGQNAALWCPPYATTAGWKMETRPEVLYTSNEVRVLCLRVEDQAGNAGVTKTTVYDGYSALETLINEYAKESVSTQ